jgi:hypothetical protein
MTTNPPSPVNATPPVPSKALYTAEMLEGAELANGWKVTRKVPKAPSSTGGRFSVQYYVEKTEGKMKRVAFLKALNFRQLFEQPNSLSAIKQHTAAFEFERETLELCKTRRLSPHISYLS